MEDIYFSKSSKAYDNGDITSHSGSGDITSHSGSSRDITSHSGSRDITSHSGSRAPLQEVDIWSDTGRAFKNESISGNSGKKSAAKMNKKRKKKKHIIRKILILALCIVLAFSGTLFTLVSVIGYTKSELEVNEYVASSSLNSSFGVTNILLLGVDAENGESGRSDTMMLLSLDFIHMKIKLTSFLRDSYVYIPSRGKSAKLNSAYAYNGGQGAVDTIEYNFGVDISHFVKVDFTMFTKIIDNLGGIDLEVTEKEAKFINRTTRHTVEYGDSVHLDGAKALVYARIRKLDSDYMRTQRQRKVISALIKKAKTAGPAAMLKSLREVLPLVETDMGSGEITALALKCVCALLFDIEQKQVPDDSMMTTGYVGSEWVEKPDLDKCKAALYEFIYG